MCDRPRKLTDCGNYEDVGFPDGMAEEALMLMFTHAIACPDTECSVNHLMSIVFKMFDVSEEQCEQWAKATDSMTEQFFGTSFQAAIVANLLEGLVIDMMEDGFSVTV